MELKELDDVIHGKGQTAGFVYRKLKESAVGYFYEGISPEETKNWEVFYRKEQKESDFMLGDREVHMEPKVMYPGNEAFGSWAWCFNDKARAEECFLDLSLGTEQYPI